MAIKKILITSFFCVHSLAMQNSNDSREYLFKFGNITHHVGDLKNIEKFGYIKKYMQKNPGSKAIIIKKSSVSIDLKILLEKIKTGLSNVSPSIVIRFIELSKEPTLTYLKDVVTSYEDLIEILNLASSLENNEIKNLCLEYLKIKEKMFLKQKITEQFLNLIEKIEDGNGEKKDLEIMNQLIRKGKNLNFESKLLKQMKQDYNKCKKLFSHHKKHKK